ncbi:phosphoribosylaminoimidazolesuccinocarboxamide synthase [Paenibacillus chartarius]|uniref:Phosphoribosylaminoimidazole-succinocarboxamide synthase n=1 Tax=Paenibacillus chartarius TaxID=747481 RepID=A0ABV6DL77_9BACL
MTNNALLTAEGLVEAPLVYKGKVRELYDLGEHFLIVVTDRISAFDYILKPGVPDKGRVLNRLSEFWFNQMGGFFANHMIHTDITKLIDQGYVRPENAQPLVGRVMVTYKAIRIPVECVVRGYITGGGWRQYQETGKINGHELPAGLRKNEKLPSPIFTPAIKNDVGHDEDITIDQMIERFGENMTKKLMQRSQHIYANAQVYCEDRGIILADTKFEFGFIGDQLLIIDEMLTPDSSRFWAKDKYALDIEIDSLDKEPVRTYLANSGWDKNSEPDPLPDEVVQATADRYHDIYRKLTSKID